MGLPRACALACGLVLLLSVSSAQSIAADEPPTMSGAMTAWTPVVADRAQSQFLAYADVIIPDFKRSQTTSAESLLAQPRWLMPLPDFSAPAVASKLNANKSEPVTAPNAPTVAGVNPGDPIARSSAGPKKRKQEVEPFGLLTIHAPQGLLWTKWQKVQSDIEAEAPALTRCRASADRCSPAAARFVAIVDEAVNRHGRARLALINERINAAIRYTSDMKQWHRSDRWSAPLDRRHMGSFDTGMGDCEDYAIAKYVALRAAGTPARDLRLLLVRDTSARTNHAVLAARQDGKWLLLDNRWRRLIADDEAPFFRPLFALDATGVTLFAKTSLAPLAVADVPAAERGYN